MRGKLYLGNEQNRFHTRSLIKSWVWIENQGCEKSHLWTFGTPLPSLINWVTVQRCSWPDFNFSLHFIGVGIAKIKWKPLILFFHMSFPINPLKKEELNVFLLWVSPGELISRYLTTQLCAWFKYLPWEPNSTLECCKCLKSTWNLGGNQFHSCRQNPNQAFCTSSLKSSDQWHAYE